MHQQRNLKSILLIGKKLEFFPLVLVIIFLYLIRNFTSPQMIRVESGIAHVMEQYDRSFKVQQLMGADAKHFNPAEAQKKQPGGRAELKKAVSFKVIK